MVIDIHAHAFPDKVAPKAMEALTSEVEINYYSDGTISGLLKNADEAGIDYTVVANIATRPTQVQNITDFSIENNNGKLIMFGSIYPFEEDNVSIVKNLAGSGIKGIKMHPEYQQFDIDDKRMYPVYREIFDNDMVLLLHTGFDIAFDMTCHCHATPDMLLQLSKDFPGAKIIAAHMGGWKRPVEVYEKLCGTDLYFDTSASSDILGLEDVAIMIKKHGADKILFATDSPWFLPKSEIEFINSLNLTDTEKIKILGENAKKMLKV